MVSDSFHSDFLPLGVGGGGARKGGGGGSSPSAAMMKKKERRNFEISTLLRQEGNGRRKGNREKSSPTFFAPWKKYVSYSLLRRENWGVGLFSGCSSIVHLARSWVSFFPRRWRQSLPDRGGQAQAVGFSLCVCAAERRPNTT